MKLSIAVEYPGDRLTAYVTESFPNILRFKAEKNGKTCGLFWNISPLLYFPRELGP